MFGSGQMGLFVDQGRTRRHRWNSTCPISCRRCDPRRSSCMPGRLVIPEGRSVAALIRMRGSFCLGRNHLLLETDPAWAAFVTAIEKFLEASLRSSGCLSFDGLTAREREVLEILARGLNNSEIAGRLKINEKTSATMFPLFSASSGSAVEPRLSCSPRSRISDGG